jgi:uncharacterized protein
MATVIVTYTGRRFEPLNPDPNDIDPYDIAHALSQQCRYTGHTKFLYSVATHVCLVHDAVVALGGDEEEKKWAIHHDDSEAYLLDLAAPLKHDVDGFGEKFLIAETAIEEAVSQRFDMFMPIPDMVKKIDTRIREDEIAQLFPAGAFDGLGKRGTPLGIIIPEWTPRKAEYEYAKRIALYDDIPYTSLSDIENRGALSYA